MIKIVDLRILIPIYNFIMLAVPTYTVLNLTGARLQRLLIFPFSDIFLPNLLHLLAAQAAKRGVVHQLF